MLNDLHDIIAARLTEINLFEYVGTALQDEPKTRPDALIWLEEDAPVVDTPGIIRQLTWGIQLSVNHSVAAGAAQTTIYNLVDAVRDAFSGWNPKSVQGIKPDTMSVAKIKLTGHESHGPTKYTALLSFQVFPKMFVKL